MRLRNNEVPDHEPIDARAVEATNGIFRTAYYRLPHHVERSIHEHRHPRQCFELLDQPVVTWVVSLAYRLNACRADRVLAFWDNGFRHLSNRVRPIRAPEDCRGLRLRTLSSALHTETFRRLGFDPVALDVKELIAAVQAGTIDAQDNPLTNIYNFGIHEFHPHITLTAHFFGAAVLLCHKASWESWSTEVRQAVDESVAEATAAQREFAAAEDVRVRTALATTDAQVVDLSEEERDRFRAAVASVVDTQSRRLGASWVEALDP